MQEKIAVSKKSLPETVFKPPSHLQLIKPYILVFACLMIGMASIGCLILSVIAALSSRPYLATLPFSAFVLTLRMAYSLARMLIA
jgi:hypothetical protein